MGQFAALKTDGTINQPIQRLLAAMLDKEIVTGVMVPARQAFQQAVMQTLFTDGGHLESIDPFAPVVPTNSAKVVCSLTHRPTGRRVAAVMRSCEIRAFLELVKLHQGSTNRDYLAMAETDEDLALTFLRLTANGGGQQSPGGAEIASACKACTHPVADNVDLRLCVIGADPAQEIYVQSVSDRGQEIFEALGLEATPAPENRDAEVEALIKRRAEFREVHLAAFTEQCQDIEGLARVVAPCINCYNCRVACPVCYCRECVFGTDTMRHDGEQYLKWSQKRGRIRLPADTLFYHLTRMVHMSTLCVGCGQCTSACPNDVPVWEILSTVADRTQARFDYMPGRSLEEEQPLAVFFAEEFDEVTGQVK
jgi:formate dehydrogenase subunit beta